MSKEKQRGNREIKKPKSAKKPDAAAGAFLPTRSAPLSKPAGKSSGKPDAGGR